MVTSCKVEGGERGAVVGKGKGSNALWSTKKLLGVIDLFIILIVMTVSYDKENQVMHFKEVWFVMRLLYLKEPLKSVSERRMQSFIIHQTFTKFLFICSLSKSSLCFFFIP